VLGKSFPRIKIKEFGIREIGVIRGQDHISASLKVHMAVRSFSLHDRRDFNWITWMLKLVE
jgi:hypothetical protein